MVSKFPIVRRLYTVGLYDFLLMINVYYMLFHKIGTCFPENGKFQCVFRFEGI